MGVPELIARKVTALPADQQQEVLDFVEFLAARRRAADWSDSEFGDMALGQALRETEADPVEYGPNDCIETWP